MNCPFTAKKCRYCTASFCADKEEKQIEIITPKVVDNVDSNYLLEKEIQTVKELAKDTYEKVLLLDELLRKGNKGLNKKPNSSNDSDIGSPWRNHIIEDINN